MLELENPLPWEEAEGAGIGRELHQAYVFGVGPLGPPTAKIFDGLADILLLYRKKKKKVGSSGDRTNGAQLNAILRCLNGKY